MGDKKSRLKKSNSKSEISTSSSESTSSFLSDDDSDNEALKPIKDYLKNRREVARQLFKSVKMEKIRMMLPQNLKKVDLTELEDLCANELCGMSKTRILSILNSTPMSNSSNTSDSDGSGPSLEIISDTEEWLTDDEPHVKREPLSPSSKFKKMKTKGKIKVQRKNGSEIVKSRKGKARSTEQNNITKVKKETEKGKVETKKPEGESLLDLLELEMRARAIRALIRKEEDVIPTPESEQKKASNISALKSTLTTVQSKKSKSQIHQETVEAIVEKIGEDEDVVLLIKPTPTIELISSDSESENSASRMTKNLCTEHTPEKRVVKIDKSASGPDGLKIVVKQKVSETSLENSGSGEKTKGIKTKKDKTKLSSKTVKKSDEKSNKVVSSSLKSDLTDSKFTENTDAICEIKKEKNNPVQKNTKKINDDKLDNYDEIIDLDDYPDDMYSIEPEDSDPTPKENVVETIVTASVENTKENQIESAETWATRYYQTDNVQNVIKESKIQSEIRKRLRERQRLSKLNNSPKPIPAATEAVIETIKPKPTGSVQEYFALKGASTVNVASVTSNASEHDDIKGKIDKESSLLIEKNSDITTAVPSTSITDLPPLNVAGTSTDAVKL